MIQVGNTGLYFDGGHKGDLDIYIEDSHIFRSNIHFQGVNVDCTGEIFKFLLNNAPFNGYINPKRFLKNHEYLIKSAIKHQFQSPSNRRLCECYNCGVELEGENVCIDDNGEEHICCPPMCIDPEWHTVDRDDNDVLDGMCDRTSIADNPLIQIKDFDLRSEYIYGLHMICKIKSIKTPAVINRQYSQKCSFYDEGTSKIIKAELQDSVADYDKWNINDTVEAWGIYRNNCFEVTSMKLIEVQDSEPAVTNRNVETPGYNEWRQSIINRDEKCVCCGLDKHLEAHHLFGYAENPALAVDEHNGVTLCKFCHDKYHSIYGVKDINPVDFVEFVKKFGVVR